MRQSFSVFWWRGSQKRSPSLKLLSLFAGWASLRSTHKSSVPSPALSLCDAAGDNHPVGSWMPHCPRPGLDWAAEPAGPYGLSPKPWTSTPYTVGPPPFISWSLFIPAGRRQMMIALRLVLRQVSCHCCTLFSLGASVGFTVLFFFYLCRWSVTSLDVIFCATHLNKLTNLISLFLNTEILQPLVPKCVFVGEVVVNVSNFTSTRSNC